MENLSIKSNEKFSIINNTDELLEFKLNVNSLSNEENEIKFNEIYSLYPEEKFEEFINLNKNINIDAKFYFDYGNITREYELNSTGIYSFEKEAVLKDLKTNKFFGDYNVKLSLRNVSNNQIDIRISNNGIGNDSEFSLNKFDFDTWERNAGEVIVQVRERNSIFKFMVNCPGNLFYKGDGILCDENLHFRINKNLKFENDIGAVSLRNISGCKINVRFSTNGIGSADFWPINNQGCEAWNRNYGNVFLEVKIDNKNSFQYEVEVPKKYIYEGNGVLLEEFTNNKINIVTNAKF